MSFIKVKEVLIDIKALMSFTKVKEVLIDIKAVSSILLFIITTVVTVIIVKSCVVNTTKDSKITTETYKQLLDSKDLKGD